MMGPVQSITTNQTHQYVTAIIKVRAMKVIVVTLDGQVIHDGDYSISRVLR